MDTSLFKNWWLLLLNAFAATIFGLLAIFLPDITLVLLINYFGILAVFGGMFFMMSGILNRRKTQLWRFWIFEGTLNFLIGIAILMGEARSLIYFITLVALWALITGLTQLVTSFQIKRIPKKWLYLFHGTISVFFGFVIMLKNLDVQALALVLGFYAIITGIFSLMVSMVMRKVYIETKNSTTKTFTINHED